MKILLVEDHDELRHMTTAHLRERGFVVDSVHNVEYARAALLSNEYDVMVLDMGLPDEDGDVLLDEPGTPPVLILTANDQIKNPIAALNAGADDYMVKPFDLSELEARLRAILRRPGRRSPIALTLGRIRFETASRESFVDDKPLNLSRRETLLLEMLLSAGERIVVRDLLADRLYGFNEPVTPNALEAAVSRLRRALEEVETGVILETRRGVGYRLRAAVL